MLLVTGAHYVGHFKNGQMDGRGKYTANDDNWFTGEWKEHALVKKIEEVKAENSYKFSSGDQATGYKGTLKNLYLQYDGTINIKG